MLSFLQSHQGLYQFREDSKYEKWLEWLKQSLQQTLILTSLCLVDMLCPGSFSIGNQHDIGKNIPKGIEISILCEPIAQGLKDEIYHGQVTSARINRPASQTNPTSTRDIRKVVDVGDRIE